jgi:hypothetical protein
MLNEPPELIGLTQEEKRFWRLIEERETNPDGSQNIVLACGHERKNLMFTHSWQYAKCEECEQLWAIASKPY